jgi:IS5 family transposase
VLKEGCEFVIKDCLGWLNSVRTAASAPHHCRADSSAVAAGGRGFRHGKMGKGRWRKGKWGVNDRKTRDRKILQGKTGGGRAKRIWEH